MSVRVPRPLGVDPAFPFVGRQAELDVLRSLAGGSGGVVLVGGEPGSGKTRLARELAHEAVARGALVAYGAADAVVSAPYEPFVDVLDHVVRSLDDRELREALVPGGGELARLLPDLAARVPDLPAPAEADADTERHRLHTAVAQLLDHASRARALVVVIDDAHWADPPTLHLLRYLTRVGVGAQVLLLVAFREPETDVSAEFPDTVVGLSRVEGVVRIRLTGLDGAGVTEFIRRCAGVDAETELSHGVGELTRGNPFLLCELWRAMVETGTVETASGRVRLTRSLDSLRSPEGVRDVVEYRLSRLAPETRALVEVGSVVGAQFELAVVREAAGIGGDRFGAAVDEAVRSATIEEIPGGRLVYRFAHELVRRALYDRLTGLRRAELHLRVGEALEREHAADPGRVLADLAHHFGVGAPVGGAARAVEYNLRAADAAMSALAFEEAAARVSTALELGIADEDERGRALLLLGAAQEHVARPREALAAFRRAAALGRARGDAELVAHAAIGFEDACWVPAFTGPEVVALLREAAQALPREDSELRARVGGSLSRALVFAGEPGVARDVLEEAVAMARRAGDDATLATVLTHAFWARATMPLDEVLRALTEARDLGAALGDAEILAEATRNRIVTLVAMCDLDAARREVAAFALIAEQARQPDHLYATNQFASALALCDGRLDEAEAAAERSAEWAQLLRGPMPASYGIQLFGIRREQGRLDEVRPLLELLARSERAAPTWRPGLVALLAELGLADEAQTELSRIRAEGLSQTAPDFTVASLAYLADACAAIGDAEAAAFVYPQLLPYAGRNVQIGQLAACYGSVDRYLGMLAGVTGRWVDAERHFETALALNRRMGANTWAAHTAYEHAHALARRSGAGDRARAADLAARAAEAARRFGLRSLEGKVRALGLTAAPVELPDGLSPREIAVLRLIASGRTNREIGRELFISEHTAANHVRSILRKTGCANRTDATAYAYRQGLVTEAATR